MPWSFLLLASFGMGTMMRSEREMGIVFYATGSFCWSCSKPLRTITMPEQPSVYLSLKSTYFRTAAQLLWSRTVDTRGRAGCNTPMDLHLEHLNGRPTIHTLHLQRILTVLEEVKVFYPLENRKHSYFQFKNGWLQHLSEDKTIDMIKKNVERITMP